MVPTPDGIASLVAQDEGVGVAADQRLAASQDYCGVAFAVVP